MADDLVGLHATDPATIYLSVWARQPGVEVEDIERALYDDRTVVRMLAMRRTMFVVPVHLVPVLQRSCSDAVARRQRTLLVQLVEAGGLSRDSAALGPSARAGDARRHPGAGERHRGRAADRRAGAAQAGARLGGQGLRDDREHGQPGAHRAGRPRPHRAGSTRRDLGGHAVPLAADPSSGPTELGAAVADDALPAARRGAGRASSGAGSPPSGRARSPTSSGGPAGAWPSCGPRWPRSAPTRSTSDGTTGLVLPGDSHDAAPDVGRRTPSRGSALLPALDPTVMGWFERDWYLGPHRSALFDRNGNAGPTVWSDGRVVGGWAHRADGTVAVRLLEDVGRRPPHAVERARGPRSRRWLGVPPLHPTVPHPPRTGARRMKLDTQLGGFADAADQAGALAAAGFAGAFTFDGPHDPFPPLVLAAAAGHDLDLYTNVAIALPRNPMQLAHLARDLARPERRPLRPRARVADTCADRAALRCALRQARRPHARARRGAAGDLHRRGRTAPASTSAATTTPTP